MSAVGADANPAPAAARTESFTGGVEMSGHMRVRSVVLIAGISMLVGAAGLRAQAQIPFEEAQIYFEFNSSAQDLGIQVFLDGEGWTDLEIVDPNGKKLLDVSGKGSVGLLGLTELFFESVEPSFDERTFDEILALFPEGEYDFHGVTVEGDEQVGTATLTHDIPDGPVILSPAEGGVVDRENTVLRWLPVTTPAGIQIERYEIIVERASGDRVFDVAVSGKLNSVLVPKAFLRAHTKYICEVLAKEVSGNQTITECSFETL
jgi:hypothetical protein